MDFFSYEYRYECLDHQNSRCPDDLWEKLEREHRILLLVLQTKHGHMTTMTETLFFW